MTNKTLLATAGKARDAISRLNASSDALLFTCSNPSTDTFAASAIALKRLEGTSDFRILVRIKLAIEPGQQRIEHQQTGADVARHVFERRDVLRQRERQRHVVRRHDIDAKDPRQIGMRRHQPRRDRVFPASLRWRRRARCAADRHRRLGARRASGRPRVVYARIVLPTPSRPPSSENVPSDNRSSHNQRTGRIAIALAGVRRTVRVLGGIWAAARH